MSHARTTQAIIGYYVDHFGQRAEILMPVRSVGVLEPEGDDETRDMTLVYAGRRVVLEGLSPAQYEEL